MSFSSVIDVSKEFQLIRCGGGVKLLSPDNKIVNHKAYSVAQLLNMPFNVFFMDTSGTLIQMNESSADACGFVSLCDAIGRTVYSIADKEVGNKIKRHDNLVIATNNFITKDVEYQHAHSDSLSSFVSFKFPLYSENNQTIGIFGCAISLDNDKQQDYSKALLPLVQTGLLMSGAPQAVMHFDTQLKDIHLTLREQDVLQQLSLGKSNKAIGLSLGIAQRTVDEYLAKLRSKLDVSSRNELVEKIISLRQEQHMLQ